jgi:pyruvate kinase
MTQLISTNRQTKIVATIGSSSKEKEVLREMILAGLNVARMNMSHGDQEEHAGKINTVRTLCAELDASIAVLVDLAGPKIRIGDFNTETITLLEGDKFVLTTEKIVGDAKRVYVNYEKLPKEIKKGSFVMLNDGKQKLVVEKVSGKTIHCKILVGGEIRGRRGVNLPGSYLSLSALTDKDRGDIDFAVAHKAEFLAISFVRTKKDILDLKTILSKKIWKPKIIAKIETQEAVANILEILEEVDGIMVARGDLAVEIPKERVPVVQKKIIKLANEKGRLVITATQMLASMQFSPVPSRAEVSDVANAIFDGTDAVMLSEETAVGNFPVLAVRTMSDIAVVTDAVNDPRQEYLDLDLDKDAIKKQAVLLAKTIKAKAIIALTETGSTPFKISRFKNNIPIIAVTDKKSLVCHLALAHGVSILYHEAVNNFQELRKTIKEIVKKYSLAKKGEKVVVASGFTFGTSGATNMIFIEEVL